MVMDYMNEGNLRQYLSKNYNELKFEDKLRQLFTTAVGLHSIHQANLIHQDFHPGNVLNSLQSNNQVLSLISDLGLSRPADVAKESGKIYGVLPYIAPEVIREKNYTQTSDVYSFGMIAYEILSGLPPFLERDYNIHLTLDICNGLRPNLEKVIAPQLLKDLVSRC